MSILKAVEAERRPQPRVVPSDTQQVCIDLPGEEVRCVVHKPKLEIVLRKHRDVIFEIQLFKGMTYSVEADQSDFYNARDKKIVLHKKRQAVTFKDGERLHLWVSREFKGALILKANGNVWGRYEPNKLDPVRYGADPKTKPAPLIVVMKHSPSGDDHGGPTAAQPKSLATPLPLPKCTINEESFSPLNQYGIPMPRFYTEMRHARTAGAGDGSEQSMHVVEVKRDHEAPPQIAEFFKRGGEQTAIDSTGILTRNWLWQQITGGAAYVNDNRQWIKDLWRQKFYLQKVIHKSGPKWYIIFKGNPGLREFLKGTRYGVTNAKVLAITAGAGSAAGLRHAAWDAAKGAFKKAGMLALIFTITIDYAEWLADYEQRDPKTGKPKKDVFDLVYKIGVDVVKAGVSAALGSLIVGGLITAAAGLGVAVAAPVLAVVVATVVVSVAVGIGLDWLDKKTGATDKLNQQIRGVARDLESRLSVDYRGYVAALETAT